MNHLNEPLSGDMYINRYLNIIISKRNTCPLYSPVKINRVGAPPITSIWRRRSEDLLLKEPLNSQRTVRLTQNLTSSAGWRWFKQQQRPYVSFHPVSPQEQMCQESSCVTEHVMVPQHRSSYRYKTSERTTSVLTDHQLISLNLSVEKVKI